MGEHDAPESWLHKWQQQEPLRLWLGSVAAAVIALAVIAGWLTQELAVGVAGVVAALLMLGTGWWPARSQVYAPLTVQQLLDRQHVVSYEHGAEDMLTRELGAVQDVAAQELQQTPARTEQMPQMGPHTAPRESLRPCAFMEEDGRRCTLREHPRRIPHHVEAAAAE